MAFLFCAFNGFFQAHSIIYTGEFGRDEHTNPRFIAGCVIFVFGIIVNIDSDRRLRLLRRGSEGYKIPYGGLFEFVSAANYFGEICEWIGFAVATLNAAGTFFAVWSLFFLGTRGVQHHRFYLQKFDNYPLNRRAVIPFLL